MKLRQILMIGILLALLSLSLCLCGCGGKSSQPENDARSLLGDVSQAMSGVSGYRETGNQTIEGSPRSGSEGNRDVQGEVQIVNGETHSHYLAKTPGPGGLIYPVDTYVIGEQTYVNNGSKWTQANTTLLTFNQALDGFLLSGMAEPTQLDMIAATAENLQISDSGSDKTTLTFHLAKDCSDARMSSFKNQLEQSGRWTDDDQQELDQFNSSGWQADITLSVFKANNLIDHMETQSTMTTGRDSHQETIKTTYDLFDYNQDIRVDLPEEAKSASSTNNSSP